MAKNSDLNLVYIALGGNVGDVLETQNRALKRIKNLSHVVELRVSGVYETTPVVNENKDQPSYTNGVCSFKTTLSPHELFAKLEQIEKDLGKRPKKQDDPRPIDLDLLFYSSIILKSDNLEIPHPRWSERLFVLKPLTDLTKTISLGSQTFNLMQMLKTFPNHHREVVKLLDRTYKL